MKKRTVEEQKNPLPFYIFHRELSIETYLPEFESYTMPDIPTENLSLKIISGVFHRFEVAPLVAFGYHLLPLWGDDMGMKG